MKLTDEQREEIHKRYSHPPIIECINNIEIIAVAKGDMERILSSEQAWKEEAERLQRQLHESRSMKQFAISERHELAETRLNQAIEVLEWIAECGTDYQSIRRARGFISSLQEDKT